MNKQTKVLLSILGVVVVGAVVLASSNSEMFQGRAGRDVGRSTRATESTQNTTTVVRLGATTITAPSFNEVLTNYPRKAYLAWTSVDGASSYDIEMSCDICESTTNLYSNTMTYTASGKHLAQLVPGGDNTYRFRVRGRNDDTPAIGPWSEYSYFSYDTSSTPSDDSMVALELDASANVLAGSFAELLSAVSKGYKVTVTKDINAAPKPLSFECADIRTGIDTGDYEQKHFTCRSKNVDGNFYEVEYTDNKINTQADGIYLVSVAVGEKTFSGIVGFKDLTFSVESTSVLATINGSDGSLSSTTAIPMSVFDTPLLKLTSVQKSPSVLVESFYCDLQVNDGDLYECGYPSFWIAGGNVNYVTHLFRYGYLLKGILYFDNPEDSNSMQKSTSDRTFYFSK